MPGDRDASAQRSGHEDRRPLPREVIVARRRRHISIAAIYEENSMLTDTTLPTRPSDAQRTPNDATVMRAFRGHPDAFIDVGHSRLAYRRFGRGPDVVLVHGWPLHSATFRCVVPMLANDFTLH